MQTLRLAGLSIIFFLTTQPSVFATSLAPPPQGYSVEAGDFVLVMLTSTCVNEPAEVVITPSVLEAIRAQEDRFLRMAQMAAEETGFERLPSRGSCLQRTVRTRASVVERVDGLVRLRMSNYKREYVQSVKSSAGSYYPVPGLYRNDGSVKPVWTIDWYTSEEKIVLSQDGSYLIRAHDFQKSDDDIAITFYTDGYLRKQFRASELIGHPVDRSDTGYSFWVTMELDDHRQTLTAETDDNGLYVFSLIRGEMFARYNSEDPYTSFSVSLLRRGGQSVELSDFRNCGTRTLDPSGTIDGAPATRSLYAMRTEHVRWRSVGDKIFAFRYESPDGLDHFVIPFDKIQEFNPIPNSEFGLAASTYSWDPRLWVLTRTDGSQQELLIDMKDQFYCGRASDHQIKIIGQRDIAGITFHTQQ